MMKQSTPLEMISRPASARKHDDKPLQRKENKTGMPDHLKSGIENLSGMDMGDVKVHYNSSKPAGLQAHAYAQGTNIHLAPGQERHLPHEAWHVVQQKQGRVKPTIQMKTDVAVSDEANIGHGSRHGVLQKVDAPNEGEEKVVQRYIKISDGSMAGKYTTTAGKDTKALITYADKKIGSKLKRGWKGRVGRWAGNDKKYKFFDTASFIAYLKKRFPPPIKIKKKKIRPNFPQDSYHLGRVTLGIQTGKDQSGFSPSDNDAALPHRFPYSAIQNSTNNYLLRQESSVDLIRWSDRLKKATDERLALNKVSLASTPKAMNEYEIKVAYQLGMFDMARQKLIAAVDGGQTLQLDSQLTQDFMKWTNALHGNIPDYGPHTKVNIPVSDRLHMHMESGRLTPGSRAAGSMTPARTRGLAMTDDGESLVTTDGYAFEYDTLHKDDKKLLDRQKKSNTNIDADDLIGHDF